MERNLTIMKSTKKQKEQLAEAYAWLEYYAAYGDRNGKENRGIVIAQCQSPQNEKGAIKALFVEHEYAQRIVGILRERKEKRDILFRRF